MVTSTYLSIAEYLNTTYEPDLEYVDGQLVERNVGKWEHSRIIALLTGWLLGNESEWRIQVVSDCRSRVARTRVRLPDVLLVGPGPQPPVIEAAPVLCVEVLSEGDTVAETKRKCEEYIAWGSQGIWIINPLNRTALGWDGKGWQETKRLIVPGTAIYFEIDSLWKKLP